MVKKNMNNYNMFFGLVIVLVLIIFSIIFLAVNFGRKIDYRETFTTCSDGGIIFSHKLDIGCNADNKIADFIGSLIPNGKFALGTCVKDCHHAPESITTLSEKSKKELEKLGINMEKLNNHMANKKNNITINDKNNSDGEDKTLLMDKLVQLENERINAITTYNKNIQDIIIKSSPEQMCMICPRVEAMEREKINENKKFMDKINNLHTLIDPTFTSQKVSVELPSYSKCCG